MNNKLQARQELVIRYLKDKDAYLNTEYNRYYYARTKGITVKEGLDVLGTSEIRKIMSDFRATPGWDVVSVWEEGENRFGQPTRYKRYFLKKKLFALRKDKNDQ